MKNLESDTAPSASVGRQHVITPRVAARLVQQGNRLCSLADRAGFVGTSSPDDLTSLDTTFPVLIEPLEARLRSGELLKKAIMLRYSGANQS